MSGPERFICLITDHLVESGGRDDWISASEDGLYAAIPFQDNTLRAFIHRPV